MMDEMIDEIVDRMMEGMTEGMIEGMKEGTRKEIMEGTRKEIMEGTRKEIMEAMKKRMVESMMEEMMDGMREGMMIEIIGEMKKKMTEGMTKDIMEGMRQEMKEEMKKEMMEVLRREIMEEMNNEMEAIMIEEMMEGMRKEMMKDMEGMRKDIMEGMSKDIMEGMKKETKEKMKKNLMERMRIEMMEEVNDRMMERMWNFRSRGMQDEMIQKIREERKIIMEQLKDGHPKDEKTKDDQPKDEPVEIICIGSNDRGDDFGELSYVNQNLETIMQKMTHEMSTLTAAFVALGIIFFHSIVQPSTMSTGKWWIPFCIFLSVSIIYWYTIRTIIRNYIWVRQEYRLTLDHMQKWSSSAGHGMHWMEKSSFASFVYISYRQMIMLYRQYRYLFVVLVAMSAFTSLILYACYSFLHR